MEIRVVTSLMVLHFCILLSVTTLPIDDNQGKISALFACFIYVRPMLHMCCIDCESSTFWRIVEGVLDSSVSYPCISTKSQEEELYMEI